MFQQGPVVTKDQEANIPFYMYDGTGQPLPGLSMSDIRVTFLKHSSGSIVGKTLSADNFTELGLGRYQVGFTKDELDTEGAFVVIVTKDPGYAGAMRQSTVLAYIADASFKLGGLPQNRPAWVPVYLTLSSNPVGGLAPADFTEAKIRKASDTAFTDIVLNGSNFRELLDLGNPTGVYQVYLPETELDDVGSLDLRFDAATINAYRHTYQVASLTKKRCVFRLRDNNDQPVSNVTLHFTDEATGLVYGTVATDVNGAAVIDLPVGGYTVTKTKGQDIFNENNDRIQVRIPGLDDQPATAAFVISGNKELFNLQNGDCLEVQVGGGEVQEFVFNALDPALIPPNTIGSATAAYIASILMRDGHSFTSFAGGHNYQHLVIMSMRDGGSSKIKVGGTANSQFNFDTEEQTGQDIQVVTNSWDLNGTKFVPAFPPPDASLVRMTFRLVDIRGYPVEGVEVDIVNKFDPAVLLDDNSAVLGNKVLPFFTNADGVLSDEIVGLPKLVKGSRIDIIVKGTGFIRQNVVVPDADFALTDLINSAEDLFTLGKPNLPPAPRS